MARVHHYFAYGSNLLARRLLARVPVQADLGLHRLDGHAVRFHKRGRDGSGKGDLVRTGSADCVYGAVYQLEESALQTLHRIEGVGAGYRLQEIILPGALACVCYVAEPVAIDPDLKPFTWYLALILAGARERGCPEDYWRGLAACAAEDDPDSERAALAWKLIDSDVDRLGPPTRCA